VLFFLAVLLLALWVVGLLFKLAAGLIHLALFAAVVLLVVGFIRRGGGGPPAV
jgi:hypothetical protein